MCLYIQILHACNWKLASQGFLFWNESKMSKYNDITQPPPPLPSPTLVELEDGLKLLLPLTRRGHGPGIILLTPNSDDPLAIREGVPSLLVKWAEEGYAVAGIEERALGKSTASSLLKSAVDAISRCEKCEPKDNIGLVCKLKTPALPLTSTLGYRS